MQLTIDQIEPFRRNDETRKPKGTDEKRTKYTLVHTYTRSLVRTLDVTVTDYTLKTQCVYRRSYHGGQDMSIQLTKRLTFKANKRPVITPLISEQS